jgi:hypothetical protein
MALQIEYVDDALPYHRASVRLFDGDGLGKRGRTAVLGFDGIFEIIRIFSVSHGRSSNSVG